MRTLNKITASILAIAIAISTGGCSLSIFRNNITKYPLVPALTESEVIDYYAKAMSFDAIVSKNLDVDKTNFEMRDIEDEELKSKLEKLYYETENLLGQMTYDGSSEALDIEVFHYIKSYLNDKKADRSSIVSIKQSMGYYFIDVEYNLSARTPGTFKNEASLVGLNGALVHSDYYDTDSVDKAFMQQAVTKLNNYYSENNIKDRKASFDVNSLTFSTDPSKSVLDFTDSTIEDPTVNEGTEEGNSANTTGDGTDTTASGNDTTASGNDTVVEKNTSVTVSRTPSIDISEFNTIVGGSTKNSAYMPNLDFVYNIPSSEGDISGIGIWPSGIDGLKTFGFSRDQLDGTLTMRFVYKDDIDNLGHIINTNAYPVFSEITTGFNSTNDNVVPEFLMTEFEKLIERADRAISNNDLPALMSGKIFSDMGAAILRGYESQHVNMTRQISTVRRVISRNIEENSYIIEVESQRQEGPKGANVYGTYRDKAYVVIEQVGQEFVITDWLTMLRQMQTEPDINPDSAVQKRLVALNLAGEVSDEAKTEVTELLNNLYKASTLRILNGPKEVADESGNVVELEYGMYDCFNSDPEMLSSSKKEEINSRLRGMLVKHGTEVSAQLNGVVTQWIGGADKQVEFITEELITYFGREDGVYMSCYYLVSNMEDEWVIDDLQILECEECSGQELETIRSRIGA